MMSATSDTHKNESSISKKDINFLDALSCAAYLVKNDVDMTILYGNEAFYRLFSCTKEDMHHKYGNRLGALIAADSLVAFGSVLKTRVTEPKEPFGLKLRIKRNGMDAWIYTEISSWKSEDGQSLCCLSFDITESEKMLQSFFDYEETVSFAMEQANFDVFTYEITSKFAQLYVVKCILSRVLPALECEYTDFAQMLVAANVIHPQTVDSFLEVFDGIHRNNTQGICEFRMKTLEDKYIWVRLTLTVKQTGVQAGKYAIGFLEDITQQKEAYLNYLNETQFYQAMLAEKDAYGQVDVTEDRITTIGGMWNLYNEIINRVSYSVVIEEFINKVVHPDDRRHYLDLMQRTNFIESLENGIDRLGCEFRRIVEQNKMMWMELSVHLFKDPFTTHTLALLYIQNIDTRKRQELSLLHDSKWDQLTNILNKNTAESSINDYLAKVEQSELCAFVMLDLDNFKRINDTYGHAMGDTVLVWLANLLQRSFRENDIVGRFGGDEFIVFLKNISSEEQVKERLDALYEEIEKEDNPELSCSIGVALTYGNVSYQYAFGQADMALYAAKNKGKKEYVFYHEDMPKQLENLESSNVITEERQQRIAAAIVLNAPDKLQVDTAYDVFDTFLSEQGELAYLVQLDTFTLICGNKAFYDRIGLSKKECLGKKCYELMHKRTTPCPFCSKANWSSDKFYMWKNYNYTLEQEFLIKNKLVQWQGEEVLLAISIDISNNKSIVDSIENGATESHCILSGVQGMASAENLSDAMHCALETIGHFFNASGVRFWERDTTEQDYECTYVWTKSEQDIIITNSISREVNIWLKGMQWGHPIILESPEAMLCYSYGLYQIMKNNNIKNQRWLQVRNGKKELGCLVIDNISSNFQNIAFLESFTVFIADEIKKRDLMAGIIYANQRDELTGLLSRSSYEKYLSDCNVDGLAMIGVMVANFDQLKEINSSKGFHMGNYFIREFANMLEEVFAQDAVFRLNGDEFLVIAVNISHEELEERICLLEEKIKDAGAFSVSIGCSWDDIEKNLGVLIEQSTEAMKANKKLRYDTAPIAIDAERRKMLSQLVAAIENNEFEVFLQPKVEFQNNTVVGAEALIRYHHETKGYIGPIHFIEKLETNNLIRYVDLYVFEEVCKVLEKWKSQGIELPIISVNFSRLTLLERSIRSSIEAIIARYDISRKYIEIEITESVSNMGKSILRHATDDIHKAGFSISLDDFGTSYTNLAILSEIKFDVLKLDKSLISAISGQHRNQIILKNIIHMCKELGISVIAEGIETKVQESIMRKLECTQGQGYLYGKPMPIAEFDAKYNRYC